MKLSFVVASDEPEIADVLEHSGRAEVKAVVSSLEALAHAVARHRPDAALVDLGDEPDRALDWLERLPAPRPTLIVRGPDDPQVIRHALRLGAREYLPPSVDPKDELLAALERFLRESQLRAHAGARQAPLLAVMGAKGGVGTTFIACQLAAGLAHRDRRTTIADLHLRLGDVALYFDVHPEFTITNLARTVGDVDAAYLQTVLAAHRTGVQVLAAPASPEEADAIQVHHAERIFSLLCEESDWCVVDTPRDFDERSMLVLDRATRILLVSTCDVPALNHARLQLDLLKRLGHSPHKVHVIANRVDRNAPVQAKQMADFLGRRVDVVVPNDYPTASACVNEGRSLWDVAPKSALREAMERLVGSVHNWCEVPLADASDERRGLRGLWRRKR